MSKIESGNSREETPVDEVRRIRARFEKEADGDIQKLCEIYKNAAKDYREKLDLKPVYPSRSKDEG